MGYKKLPNNKTNEELLQELESLKEVEIEDITDRSEDSILLFIRFYNIQPGKNKITSKEIYQLYSMWKQGSIESSRKFHLTLNKYLSSSESVDGKYYYINLDKINLQEKAFDLIKKNKRPAYKKSQIKQHFDNFLNKYSIQPGKDKNYIWIHISILFNLYDEWTYSIRKKNPIAKEEFYKFCKLYFEDKMDKNRHTYIKINELSLTNNLKERISVLSTGRNSEHDKKRTKK